MKHHPDIQSVSQSVLQSQLVRQSNSQFVSLPFSQLASMSVC